MRKDSPMVITMEGDEIVDIQIHCPDATCTQPDQTEKELVRIFNEYKRNKQISIESGSKEFMFTRECLQCGAEYVVIPPSLISVVCPDCGEEMNYSSTSEVIRL